jgi:hypothetical protein
MRSTAKINHKILLVDVDSKIPNLALMKISTHHKSLSDGVDIIRLGFDGYPTKKKIKIVDGAGYDLVYASCIFTVNKDVFEIVNCDDIEVGGTGVCLDYDLPNYIDDLSEDYGIYPDNNISYGFITRGCVRNCYFCFVPKKEGLITFYKNWQDIVKTNFKYTDFLDNNFLAYKEHRKILQELIDNRIRFKFNSGLDIRFLTEENAKLLSLCNYVGEFIFAFDDKKDDEIITNKFNLFKKFVPRDWGTKFDIYCNPAMPLKDIVYRIEWCRSNKALPYIMRDKTCWDSQYNTFYIDLAAYCNQPGIFKKMNFEQFLNKRHFGKNSKNRIESSLTLWNDNFAS